MIGCSSGYGRGVDIFETGECVVPQGVLESMAPALHCAIRCNRAAEHS